MFEYDQNLHFKSWHHGQSGDVWFCYLMGIESLKLAILGEVGRWAIGELDLSLLWIKQALPPMFTHLDENSLTIN